MEVRKEELCRLCLKALGKNSEQIGEITKEILDVLLLTPDLKVTQEHAICSSCMQNLQSSFNFKAACFYTEDCIVPFLNPDDTSKLDLREVYKKQNKDLNIFNILADENICRLCLNLVTDECFTHLRDVKNMLVKCVPELDLDSTREPVICTDCSEFLKHYFCFMKNCLDTEQHIKKYCNLNRIHNRSRIKLSKVVEFMQKKSRNGNLNVDDSEENCFGAKENNKSTKSLYVKLKRCEDSAKNDNDSSLTQANNDSAEIKLYNCRSCSFQTKYRGNLTKHEILHKDPSELQWFKCELCPYQEKCERYVKAHIKTHEKEKTGKLTQSETSVKENSSEYIKRVNGDSAKLMLYKCESCSFRTKHITHIRRHELVHVDPSKIRWFKCKLCSYKGTSKRCLASHLESHKKEKNERQTIFKCDKCIYQARWKSNLKAHAQTHADRATLNMHSCKICAYKTRRKGDIKDHMRKHESKKKLKCDICTFKTRYKESLKRHMNLHKDRSKLKKYTCEICAYETIYKGQLTKHILFVHMDKSKLEKHSCEKCDYTSVFRHSVARHMERQHEK